MIEHYSNPKADFVSGLVLSEISIHTEQALLKMGAGSILEEGKPTSLITAKQFSRRAFMALGFAALAHGLSSDSPQRKIGPKPEVQKILPQHPHFLPRNSITKV